MEPCGTVVPRAYSKVTAHAYANQDFRVAVARRLRYPSPFFRTFSSGDVATAGVGGAERGCADAGAATSQPCFHCGNWRCSTARSQLSSKMVAMVAMVASPPLSCGKAKHLPSP